MGAPRWFQIAWLIGALAMIVFAFGPEWLGALLAATAGMVLARGAWPVASGRDDAAGLVRDGDRTKPWMRRTVAAGAVVVGIGWFVGGIAGFLQRVT